MNRHLTLAEEEDSAGEDQEGALAEERQDRRRLLLAISTPLTTPEPRYANSNDTSLRRGGGASLVGQLAVANRFAAVSRDMTRGVEENVSIVLKIIGDNTLKIHHLRCATAALAEVWYGNGAEETEDTTNDRETEVGVVAERLSLDIVEEGEEHQRVEDGAVSREEEDVAVVGVETLATSLSHRVVSPHEDEADMADGATVGEDKEQGGQDKHDTDEEEDRAGGEEESQGDISGRSEEDAGKKISTLVYGS